MRVHVAHDRHHRVEQVVAGVDDDVEALVEQVQLGVGDQDGDLDQRVALQVEPGHLAVDPYQGVGHDSQRIGAGMR